MSAPTCQDGSRCDYQRCAAPRIAEPGTISGPVRLDRRTKRLVGRLAPRRPSPSSTTSDIDRVAADSLVASGVSAVLNAKPSISGRYPKLGPEALVRAGITLVDDLGEDLFRALHEGSYVPHRRQRRVRRGREDRQRRSPRSRLGPRGDGRGSRGLVGSAGGVRPPTRWSSSSRRRICCWTASACPTSSPRSPASTPSSCVRGYGLQGRPRGAPAGTSASSSPS